MPCLVCGQLGTPDYRLRREAGKETRDKGLLCHAGVARAVKQAVARAKPQVVWGTKHSQTMSTRSKGAEHDAYRATTGDQSALPRRACS